MAWFLAIAAAFAVSFGFVLMFGAPYLPTLKLQVNAALELVDLKPGDTLLELGCGDGRVLIAAAQRGYRAVGYEFNPMLFLIAWLRTMRYRRQVRIIYGNFWSKNWPPAEAIFTFLLPKYMYKLDRKIMHELARSPKTSIKLVSFAFTIPNKKPVEQKSGVFLYEYK
jgi:SAM-dependent methyltransferase